MSVDPMMSERPRGSILKVLYKLYGRMFSRMFNRHRGEMLIQPQHDQWQRERPLEALDAYSRGMSDAPLLRKWSGAPGEASGSKRDEDQSQGHGEPMTFVISTDEVDRHGDVIVADGWKLDSYRKNPVFLWAHDYARPVIGKAVDIWVEPHSLMAKIQFAPTEFAQEVAALYETGYQRGVSVGFKPLRYEERRHEKTGAFLGIRFLEQELLETSAVPVPANRNALGRALEQAPPLRRLKEYLAGFEAESRPWSGPTGEAKTALAFAGLASEESTGGRRTGNAGGSTALEAIWPQVLAQVDDLGKLVDELAGMLDGAGLALPRGVDSRGIVPSDVDQVLAALRESTERLSVGGGGGQAVLRR